MISESDMWHNIKFIFIRQTQRQQYRSDFSQEYRRQILQQTKQQTQQTKLEEPGGSALVLSTPAPVMSNTQKYGFPGPDISSLIPSTYTKARSPAVSGNMLFMAYPFNDMFLLENNHKQICKLVHAKPYACINNCANNAKMPYTKQHHSGNMYQYFYSEIRKAQTGSICAYIIQKTYIIYYCIFSLILYKKTLTIHMYIH